MEWNGQIYIKIECPILVCILCKTYTRHRGMCVYVCVYTNF